jgi:hypothetical protein
MPLELDELLQGRIRLLESLSAYEGLDFPKGLLKGLKIHVFNLNISYEETAGTVGEGPETADSSPDNSAFVTVHSQY